MEADDINPHYYGKVHTGIMSDGSGLRVFSCCLHMSILGILACLTLFPSLNLYNVRRRDLRIFVPRLKPFYFIFAVIDSLQLASPRSWKFVVIYRVSGSDIFFPTLSPVVRRSGSCGRWLFVVFGRGVFDSLCFRRGIIN